MKNFAFLLIIVLSIRLNAQEDWICKDIDGIAEMEAQAHADLLQLRTNPFTNNYDIKYYRFEWTVDPRVYYIQGTVTTYFVPGETNFNEIYFELSDVFTINSVKYHNQSVNFTLRNDDLLQISLPDVIASGTLDSLSITYEGVPRRTGFGSFNQTFHGNTPIIWTLSEPYGSRDWWPGKMDLDDKIDSMDVIVRTPKPNRVASNGLLISEIEDGDDRIFHWGHRYPIASYLIAIAVTNYTSYSDFVPLPNGDSLEVLNYVYPEDMNFVTSQTRRTVQAMQLFNELFGVYPFAKEKYGHAQFGFGGGMEHQTMSFMGGWSQSLQAHELAHQWFGDKITCGSWQDIWLNEGFATYLEGLTQEAGIGTLDFRVWLLGKIFSVTSSPGGSVWVNDTTSVNRIFNGRLSYSKGAMLLHMLRWKLGDEAFFQAIRNYLNDPQLAYSYAKTADLQRHLEGQSGQDLTEFFEDWFYGEGYPSYQIEWAQSENIVQLIIKQSTSHASVDFFEMPIPVQFKGANGEVQTLRFEHTVSSQTFEVNIPFKVTEVIFDPDLWLISANNQVNQVLTATQELQKLAAQVQVFPNPAKDQMIIDWKNIATTVWQIDLFDTKGSLVRRIQVTDHQKTLDVSELSSGLYALRIQTEIGVIAKTFVKQ